MKFNKESQLDIIDFAKRRLQPLCVQLSYYGLNLLEVKFLYGSGNDPSFTLDLTGDNDSKVRIEAENEIDYFIDFSEVVKKFVENKNLFVRGEVDE